ncbi:MAG: hypothetical protein ACXWNC_02675 [Anaerolineales bacterium]
MNDLLKDLFETTQSFDQAAGYLAFQQDEDAGCDGKDPHYDWQA